MLVRGDFFLNLTKRSEYIALSDEELVELSRSGDEMAFNILAARYLNTRSSKSVAAYFDSDDFVQEGMFGFLNAVRTYDSSTNVPFKAYSSVCMRNSINSAAGNLSSDIPTDVDSDTFTSIQGEGDPLDRVVTSERLSEVLDVCDQALSGIEKTVVLLLAAGLSYSEIGDRLDMELKSVDNAVQRARRKIKKAITH
jgi:RNA polymerase sporulation-specific sigma factor